MDRFSRKNRSDINYLSTGSFFDAIDNGIKRIWRINDEELDYICGEATDDEMFFIALGETNTISDIKKGIEIVNKLLDRKNNLVI